jgi:endoglucanase
MATSPALERGISLGGALDRRDGRPGWEARPRHLAAIATAGFDLVRLPVRWWGHAPGDGLLETVATLVDAAFAEGLAVIVTMHHADEVNADPAGTAAELAGWWRRIAARFAGARGPLAFELLNEPRMPAGEWNALLPEALSAVREADPTRPVIVGGADASSVAGLRELELPPDEHLIATVHYYEPFRFTHQGASWEPGSEDWVGTVWGSDADHAAVTADLESAAAWARRHDVPLLAGEFGTIEIADRASRVRWTRWVRTELERLGVPWAYWDFATDFGAYDLERGEWRADLLSALIPSGRRPVAPYNKD